MVYILLGDGFEETEAIVPADLLRRAGVEVRLVGINGLSATGSHAITVQADMTLDQADPDQVELLFLPGGMGGVSAIQESPAALALVRAVYDKGKYVTAICAAPTILGKLGLLQGRKAVCYPGMEVLLAGAQVCRGKPYVVDGTIVTGEAAGSALPFGLKLVELLRGREAALQVAQAVHYHGEL